MSEREYSAHSGLSRGAIQKARKQGRQDEDQSRSTEIHEIKCHMLAAAAPLIAMLWRNAGATGGKRSCGSAALLLYESAVANVRPTDLDLQKHTDHGMYKVRI